MKNIRIILFILFLLNNYQIQAQIQISGTIIDTETKNPIEFATIEDKKLKTGTISNKNGNFIFNTNDNALLEIKHIGYKYVKITVNELKIKSQVFLEKEPIILSDVVLMPESTLKDLLKKSFNKIPDNYPSFETNYEGFYREILKIRLH